MISFARGVPAPECLPVEALADCARAALERDGRTILNYGPVAGYEPLREWVAARHEVEPSQVLVGGNSSLTMMHTTIVDFLLHGGVDSPRPWSQEEKVTFICPVPGYDRHYSMLASFGILYYGLTEDLRWYVGGLVILVLSFLAFPIRRSE